MDDKVDKDVIGFFGLFRLRVFVVDQKPRTFAQSVGVLSALLEGAFGGLDACEVAALAGFDEGVCGGFLFGEGEVITALQIV